MVGGNGARRGRRYSEWALLGLVATAMLLGGASRDAPWRLALVELAALPALYFIIRREGPEVRDRAAWWLWGMLALIPLLQSIPLPPFIWRALPQGEPRFEALSLAGLKPGWLPLSLTPGETLGNLVALFPPLAAFNLTDRLGDSGRRRLIWLLVGLGILSMGLGMAQWAGGPVHGPYLFEYANRDSPTGLFANRNHEAALVLCLLPLAAALARPDRTDLGQWLAPILLLAGGVSVGVLKSRTGVVLAAPVAILSIALYAWRLGRVGPIIGAAVAGLAAVAGVAVFALTPLLARFGAAGEEPRFIGWRIGMQIARDNWPWGSGLGSFDTVYRAYEGPDQVSATFFQHAHNDVLETAIEAGLPGLIVGGLFLIWWTASLVTVWRTRAAPGGGSALAAVLVTLVLMIFSLGDYPLRTPALAVVFACACALISGRRRFLGA
jgi:O-antigen ligase